MLNHTPAPCPDRHIGCAQNVTALQEAQAQVAELKRDNEELAQNLTAARARLKARGRG